MKNYDGDITITKKVYEEMASEIHDARMVFRIMQGYIDQKRNEMFLVTKYQVLVEKFEGLRRNKHAELYPELKGGEDAKPAA